MEFRRYLQEEWLSLEEGNWRIIERNEKDSCATKNFV